MQLRLTLYIAGAGTVRSMTAKRRLDDLVARLDVDVEVDVVDVFDQPDRAERSGVFATPTLVRELPDAEQRLIGDLSDTVAVATTLGVQSLLRPSVVSQ